MSTQSSRTNHTLQRGHIVAHDNRLTYDKIQYDINDTYTTNMLYSYAQTTN